MNNALIGFVSGVFVTLAGAIISGIIQRYNEERRAIKKARFEVYMNLLDVKSLYFWITSAEMHNEEVDNDLWRRLFELSWKVLEKLREYDKIEFLGEIIDVLLNDNYKSAADRDKAMEILTGKLGVLVNPKYAEEISRVSTAKQQQFIQNIGNSNAPGAVRIN